MQLLKALLLVVAVTTRAVTGLLCEHQWEGEFADHHVDGVPYLQARQNDSPPPLDIQPLIVNGPSSNRVDIIFLGDGCMYEPNNSDIVIYLTLEPCHRHQA
jgi:hypothetical protein